MKTVPLGVNNLDTFIPGIRDESLNMIYGPPGSGKTIFAMQYLAAGARRGENVLYISLDQPTWVVKKNFEDFDLFLDEVYIFDAVPIVSGKAEVKPVREVTPITRPSKMRDTEKGKKVFEADVLSLRATLKNVFDRVKFDRIVVDSITSLRYFYMRGINPDSGVHTFLNFLEESSRSAILVTAESYDKLISSKPVMDSVFFINSVNREFELTIEKSTVGYAIDKIPLVLTKNGFSVEDKFYVKFTRRGKK
ncbi:RecA-superfamily ATPase possibly involved in signal transduction [Aciduliprofundum sp. MAR08-339]|uniref:RAD55 family ATPase n=1 Tax=Aciduliprofundum sp. (strain MAR08-339) TaxID=673860 RepID=UPI0002A4BD02|nr:RecA-superfamily ATPase possibly involved in signal transduction [Aciduliprofundum sp. MAR08-339]